MAITDLEFLRFRKKPKAQDGGGEQVLNAIEEREKAVQQDAAAAAANVEVELILFFTRKQWRLIRISSFLYVLSFIFMLLVGSLMSQKNYMLILDIGGNWQYTQQAGTARQLFLENRRLEHPPVIVPRGGNTRQFYCPQSWNPRLLPSWAVEFLRRIR